MLGADLHRHRASGAQISLRQNVDARYQLRLRMGRWLGAIHEQALAFVRAPTSALDAYFAVCRGQHLHG